MNLDSSLGKFKHLYSDFTVDNEHYLIYFKQSDVIKNEIKLIITNFDREWCLKINQTWLNEYKNSDILNILYESIDKKKFNLTKVNRLNETTKEYLKFEINMDESSGKSIKFYLEQNEILNSTEAIKRIVFDLYERNKYLEAKLQQENDEFVSSRDGEGQKKIDKSQKGASHSLSNSLYHRKPGMSIINPNSRKRKVPKGVQFSDDNNNNNIDSD